jgi:hypothetical protein
LLLNIFQKKSLAVGSRAHHIVQRGMAVIDALPYVF